MSGNYNRTVIHDHRDLRPWPAGYKIHASITAMMTYEQNDQEITILNIASKTNFYSVHKHHGIVRMFLRMLVELWPNCKTIHLEASGECAAWWPDVYAELQRTSRDDLVSEVGARRGVRRRWVAKHMNDRLVRHYEKYGFRVCGSGDPYMVPMKAYLADVKIKTL